MSGALERETVPLISCQANKVAESNESGLGLSTRIRRISTSVG